MFRPSSPFCCVATKFVKFNHSFRSRDIRIVKLAKLFGRIPEFKFSIKLLFEEFTAFYFQAFNFEIASNSQLDFKLNFKFKSVQRMFIKNQVEFFLMRIISTEDFQFPSGV